MFNSIRYVCKFICARWTVEAFASNRGVRDLTATLFELAQRSTFSMRMGAVRRNAHAVRAQPITAMWFYVTAVISLYVITMKQANATSFLAETNSFDRRLLSSKGHVTLDTLVYNLRTFIDGYQYRR